MITIDPLPSPGDGELASLLDIWEDSVRATHHFLCESDIVTLRPQVREAFDAVSLLLAKNESGAPIGFAGMAGDRLGMLFIRAESQGRRIGRALLEHALKSGVRRLDANEQNPEAVGFHQRVGFVVIGRSETDAQGNPLPVLHMQTQGIC